MVVTADECQRAAKTVETLLEDGKEKITRTHKIGSKGERNREKWVLNILLDGGERQRFIYRYIAINLHGEMEGVSEYVVVKNDQVQGDTAC